MKILVISQPVWSNENNSGNTLSNIFGDFDAEFANIYFAAGIPNNNICELYYQISDYMIIQKLTKNKKVGKRIGITKNEDIKSSTNFEHQAKQYKNIVTDILREVAWKSVDIKTIDLVQFITEFNPDIIWAPCYGNFRMLRNVLKIKEIAKCPLVSFISDDLYTYKRNIRNPLKLISQYFLRKSIRKYFNECELVYTMTEEQKSEYEKSLGKSMRILRKNQSEPFVKHEIHKPMSIIYAGGLYEGREESLCNFVNELSKIDKDGKRFLLNIYTSSKSENETILNNRCNSFLHHSLPYHELMTVYSENDIALHIESFDDMYAQRCRLSFSTKILDCLQSGAAVLCICPEDNAGYNYLKREKGAICISDMNILEQSLGYIENNYDEVVEMAKKCLEKNHNKEINTLNLHNDLSRVSNQKK